MSSFIPTRCRQQARSPIDVQKIACDALSISGHKIHAPQGTGALYIKKGTLIQPQIYGGSHERQRRAGTENLPGIVGTGQGRGDLQSHWLESGGPAEMAAMRDRLQDAVSGRDGRCRREWPGSATRAEHDEFVVRPH